MKNAAIILNHFLDDNLMCREQLARVLCNYYYYPCGSNGTLTVPQFICPDVCTYVSSINCVSEWNRLEGIVAMHVRDDPYYTNDPTLFIPKCNETNLPLDFLNLSSDCCTDGGIEIPSKYHDTVIIQFNNSFLILPQSKLIFHSSNQFHYYIIIFHQLH